MLDNVDMMCSTSLSAVARGVIALSWVLIQCGPADYSASDAATPPVEGASAQAQFSGAWSLSRIERRDAAGELLAPPIEDRLGYIIYDASGFMGVTIMRPDRKPYSEGGPTAEEALAQHGTYTSYFGPFSVNQDEEHVTHHLEGSLDPRGTGSDYTRSYTFSQNTLTLQPPVRADGSKTFLTWERLPDLPESQLTQTHRRLFGVYRIESVTRHTTDGKPVPIDQYETAYILYAPSGHMSVHLMRPGRQPYAGDRPTADEALMATRTYGSYFGPFSVNEQEGYLVHHRLGSENPGGTGTDVQRFYELTDTHLTLKPPVATDDQGRQVQTALRWARVSD